MEQATINLGAITPILGQYITAKTLWTNAKASLDAQGAKPALPAFVDNVSADWEAAITARNTWEQNRSSYTADISQNATLMRTYGDQIVPYLPPNTWVRVDLSGGGEEDPDYFWVGYKTMSAIPNYSPSIVTLHQSAQPGTPLTDNMED